MRNKICLVMAAGAMALFAICSSASAEPGTCPHDSKLLNDGPTLVYGDGPGTWWGLVMAGLNHAGITDPHDQIVYLNEVLATPTYLDSLAALQDFNTELVAVTWDKNHNGYVCAYELRGTRAHYDNPYVDLTFFGISDDHVPKK